MNGQAPFNSNAMTTTVRDITTFLSFYTLSSQEGSLQKELNGIKCYTMNNDDDLQEETGFTLKWVTRFQGSVKQL